MHHVQIDTNIFTSRFSGMVMGWVGMLIFLWFLGHLAFGPTFLMFKFRSCFISLHGKPQNSFRNGQIFRFFSDFWNFSDFRFLKIFAIFQIFWILDFQTDLLFHISFRGLWFCLIFLSLPFYLRPRNTLATAGSL